MRMPAERKSEVRGRTTQRGRNAAVAALLGGSSWTTPAVASNSLRARTPPLFSSEPCLVEVDRSIDRNLRFAVDLPYEDAGRGADELADSRSLRFILACRPRDLDEELPNWLSVEDAERAFAAGIVEARPDDAEIAESSDVWPLDACLFPIAESAAITCAALGDEILADVGEIPAGVYEVWGYTFEPPLNLWTRRPGLVVVHDGQMDVPGAALPEVIPRGEQWPPRYTVRGCAASASELALHWIDANAATVFEPDAWHALTEQTVPNGAYEFELTLPEEALEKAILLRYEARRGERSWVGHVEAPIVTVPGAGGLQQSAADGVCGGSTENSTSGAGAAIDATGCTASSTRSLSPAWGLVLLGLLRARRT